MQCSEANRSGHDRLKIEFATHRSGEAGTGQAIGRAHAGAQGSGAGQRESGMTWTRAFLVSGRPG